MKGDRKKKSPVHIPVQRSPQQKSDREKPEPPEDRDPGAPVKEKRPDTRDETAQAAGDQPAAKDDIETLKKKAREYDELLDILQRLKAEYANYQKRAEREKEEWRQSCVRDTFLEVLPVADNLERAIDAARKHEAQGELLAGVELILNQLRAILAAEGITPLESTGKKFDPRYHEAVMVQETDELPPDTVISEIERGYLMSGDRVLRAAKVSVSRKPGKTQDSRDGE